MTATHIRNRCFSQRTKETPIGLITGEKPDMNRLHIFGTICYSYAHVNKKKLDPSCKQGIFIGYDKESPSYLVYDPKSNSVSKHRLVKFTDKFPDVQADDDDDLGVEITSVGDSFKIKDDIRTDSNASNNNSDSHDSPNKINSNDKHSITKNDSDDTAKPSTVSIDVPDEPDERRYPKRETHPPPYLNDYTSSMIDVIMKNIDFCYKVVPSCYKDAINCSDAQKWKVAMDEELECLKTNDTFTLKNLPVNKKAVGGRWVYAVKGDPSGNEIHKARYVAKGYSQLYGIDYYETFSPTARLESVRILMQIAVQNEFMVHQMDVKSAYLHAPIECELYIEQP